MTLNDRIAIVTGASKGIGRGIATALAASGARVAVNYAADSAGAERVVEAIVNSGGKAVAIGADVSKPADVARLFQEVDIAFGGLDVLVNNTGSSVSARSRTSPSRVFTPITTSTCSARF